ncbi:hypothetical protein MIND_00105100 [Mycena indigotica]|uniref:DUF7918 domain-containing protein n=1 Tax=Mycena indigotica TaxID=2126181 RepID=A0A8H6TEB7_9AGAR|nr:uncharacterized protein MIND_00105100 [Mycena indigotica]KAF7315885.1 hypothetical protein MIND_00105100 [Mycena indigotica]
MPKWRDQFRAWIKIDGVDAEEYGVEVDEAERVVSCWIASEVGKTFSVEWDILCDENSLSGKVYMDGAWCAGKLFNLDKSYTLPAHRTLAGALRETTVEHFMFGSLTLSDDDTLLATGPNLPDLAKGTKTIVSLPSLNIHERSKKAVTQQVQLGAPQVSSNTFRNTRPIGPDLVKFRFKYRPIEILRANGIAPPLNRAVSPSEYVVLKDDIEKVKRLEEELLATKARIAAKQVDKKPRIKSECGVIDLTGPNETVNPRPRKKIKRENGPSEVIDLT